MKEIRSALISVFSKDWLDEIAAELSAKNIKIYSTGGTAAFLKDKGVEVIEVESITEYPSILSGRVKTLHPKVFGGILARSSESQDTQELEKFNIPVIDLVVVDLYPFEETVASGGTDQEIIEKIDIGGISLIRAAAKNFNDVTIIPSKNQYADLLKILKSGGKTELSDRKALASKAFEVTKLYDSAISSYFLGEKWDDQRKALRYGENPHQEGAYVGNINAFVEQLHGNQSVIGVKSTGVNR